MAKVLLYSFLLILGLVGSQVLPALLGQTYADWEDAVRILTMVGLSFIMIRVGYEFDIDKKNLKQYGWDYVVAFTAASFPWLFVTLYFVFVLLPSDVWAHRDAWQETLLAGRFAAPTSAGVLFAMLAAAGLGATWLFRKARILAIFDDLDTVLLMIPLKMMMVGFAWQLGLVVVVMLAMVVAGYVLLNRVRIPVTWRWVLGYAVCITAGSELAYVGFKIIDESVPLHVEVLLPAFVLGCMMAYPKSSGAAQASEGGAHPEIETPAELRASATIAALFMLFVGLSMPSIVTDAAQLADPVSKTSRHASAKDEAVEAAAGYGAPLNLGRVTATQPPLSWGAIALHVVVVTVLSNLGKMFPAFCYRREASWRERLAVAIGMWPRGEVGAGVLVISVSYGIGGPIVTIAMLSLALNLVLTGAFIYVVKRLIHA